MKYRIFLVLGSNLALPGSLGTRRAVCKSELCWFLKIWRGFEKFQLFVGFWMKKLLYFQYKCSLKKVVLFTVSKLAFLCGFPARGKCQNRKVEGFSFYLHVGTSPTPNNVKVTAGQSWLIGWKMAPKTELSRVWKNLTKSNKTLQISPLYIFRVDDT